MIVFGTALIFAAAGFVFALAVIVGREEKRLRILSRFERDLIRPREQSEDIVFLAGLESLIEKEKQRLEGLDVKPQDFLLFKLTLSAAAVVLGVMSGWTVPGVGAAFLINYAANFAVARMRVSKRRQIESVALLDMLYDMAATLRVVPHFQDALEDARAKLTGRLASEIDQVLEALHAGKPVEEALLEFADRADSPLVRNWAENIMFARRAGSDMADVCLNTAAKVRERLRFGKEIRALGAGAKGTAGGIAAIVGLSVLAQVSSGQMDAVLGTAIGKTAVGLAILSMVAGTFWMWNIIEEEVEK